MCGSTTRVRARPGGADPVRRGSEGQVLRLLDQAEGEREAEGYHGAQCGFIATVPSLLISPLATLAAVSLSSQISVSRQEGEI